MGAIVGRAVEKGSIASIAAACKKRCLAGKKALLSCANTVRGSVIFMSPLLYAFCLQTGPDLRRFDEITKKGLPVNCRKPLIIMVGRTGIGPVTNGL